MRRCARCRRRPDARGRRPWRGDEPGHRGRVRPHAHRPQPALGGAGGAVKLSARERELVTLVAQGRTDARWIGLDRDTYHARLADLLRWADTVLRPHYGGYELRDCWPRHIHAIWELSTLAAEWHRTYAGARPDLARALEFYDRWLPGTMRRITDITRGCMPQCATLRSPADWTARPRYR